MGFRSTPSFQLLCPAFLLLTAHSKISESFVYEELLVSRPSKWMVSSSARNPKYEYRTEWFEQPLDHFGSAPTVPNVFKQRYLVNDTWWDPKAGPVFFYTGNEGNVEMFCQNTGLMWDIAPVFNALVVFAEHRFYGESLPYGKNTFKKPVDIAKLQYFSVEQALADFAGLIQHIRSSFGAKTNSVVAFGGSYGGMLTAWLRLKYPWSVVGGIASSAPVAQFGNLVPTDTYARIVTQNFEMFPGCAENIRRSWDVLKKEAKKAEGLRFLERTFKSCSAFRTGDERKLRDWLASAYNVMPMVNYPYPTDFIGPLPGHPVEQFCYSVGSPPTDKELMEGLAAGANMYYNFSGKSACNDILNAFADTDLDDVAWDYQACTEMVMPMSTDGVNDMFWPSPWNLTAFSASCNHRWGGAMTKPSWAVLQFGGRNIGAGSNILFSNGLLDPWHGGSILKPPSPTIMVVNISGAPHHFDLRASNPEDTTAVIAARQVEIDCIWQWILDGSDMKQWRSPFLIEIAGASAVSIGVLLGISLGSMLTFFALGRCHVQRKGAHDTEQGCTPLLSPMGK